MEPLSKEELDQLRAVGVEIKHSSSWGIVMEELKRRQAGIISRVFLGKVETYEEYLEARGEYRALEQMLDMPEFLIEQGE